MSGESQACTQVGRQCAVRGARGSCCYCSLGRAAHPAGQQPQAERGQVGDRGTAQLRFYLFAGSLGGAKATIQPGVAHCHGLLPSQASLPVTGGQSVGYYAVFDGHGASTCAEAVTNTG